jgi:hypothetical protein
LGERAIADNNSYFVVGNLANSQAEVVRIAGLLRGTESAWQAISVSSTVKFLGVKELTFASMALVALQSWRLLGLRTLTLHCGHWHWHPRGWS